MGKPMTVADLKKWLADKPDDAILLTPRNELYYTPASPYVFSAYLDDFSRLRYMSCPVDGAAPQKAIMFW